MSELPMRMPIFTYLVAAGAALLALLILSSYELPDVGSPINTSQLVGLPKVEPRPELQPLMTTSNFAAEEKERPATQTSSTAYAQETIAPKQQNAQLTKQRQSATKDKSAPREHHVAAYSHEIMMSIH